MKLKIYRPRKARCVFIELFRFRVENINTSDRFYNFLFTDFLKEPKYVDKFFEKIRNKKPTKIRKNYFTVSFCIRVDSIKRVSPHYLDEILNVKRDRYIETLTPILDTNLQIFYSYYDHLYYPDHKYIDIPINLTYYLYNQWQQFKCGNTIQVLYYLDHGTWIYETQK